MYPVFSWRVVALNIEFRGCVFVRVDGHVVILDHLFALCFKENVESYMGDAFSASSVTVSNDMVFQ